MAHSTNGRHRTPGRHNPVSELSVLASRAGVTGAKASAVLAASGGLVAAFALPASATQDTAQKATTSAPAAPVAAPAAPAISAPAASTPVKAQAIGVTGVTVIAKPKPKPKPKPVVVEKSTDTQASSTERSASTTRVQTAASRSATRTPTNNNVAQSASGIVNIARTLLGIGYVYGGETPAGFDCSGFTQYVYGKAGVSIPRTASAQQRAATRVSSPRPGDLVFYGSPAWHVGIFTGGDMMIDSPKPGASTSERHMFGTPTGFGRF
ncbi:Protein containing cell-wall hydrolase domain [Janibacter sp. HTCC2649]|uniref:C40 family peptidase n=1 Tax=Janibacter sp. HTCC2649 TaxID=313589 RepID=UPI00006711BC|nr:C40 family peptidase [Janibacter sp. HTCC2649]EAP97159.1 Protein containing cell-wall hydrolase domain [Janibacter sp. HTCC2649]